MIHPGETDLHTNFGGVRKSNDAIRFIHNCLLIRESDESRKLVTARRSAGPHERVRRTTPTAPTPPTREAPSRCGRRAPPVKRMRYMSTFRRTRRAKASIAAA